MNRKKIAIILALALSLPMSVQAENSNTQDPAARARMEVIKDQNQFHKMIDEAVEVYTAITKGPQGEVPASILQNAKCIAVIPNVLTGAVIIGGSYGEGLVSCRDSSNNWSQPAPITLREGSLGLQAGAKSADLAIFFQNDQAVKALKKGGFTIGSDISAVAGNYDSKADTSSAGVVVYSRAQGVFAGTSVNGSKLSRNQEDLASYYGKKVDYTELLEGRESPDDAGATKKLTRLFPAQSASK